MLCSRSCRRWLAIAAVTASFALPGCVTRGYPTHGGGKRFFQEQALVSGSIDAALAQIDFGRVAEMVNPGNRPKVAVPVHVYAVAHSGGGVQTGSAGIVGSVLGALPVLGAAQQARGGGPVVVPVGGVPAGPGYMSIGFETPDDMRYLQGRLIGKLGAVGLQVATPKEMAAGKPALVILVSQLGIDQSDFNAFVYSEKLLRARTRLEAFMVSEQPDPDDTTSAITTQTLIGTGVGTMRFREDFFLGFGPISGGVPEIDTTEDGR